MTYDERWLAAIVPRRHVICGCEMRPFSLGHRILLRRINSPFLCRGPITLEAFFIALEICARTFEDARDLIDSETLEIIVGTRIEMFLKTGKNIDISEKIKQFTEYIDEHGFTPVFRHQHERRETVMPVEQCVMLTLMRDLNMAESEVLNRSWTLCLMDYAALMEMSGTISIVDRDAEEEMIQRILEQEKEHERTAHN